MIDPKYIYLIGNLLVIPIWLFFFIKRKDLRHEMIFIGLIYAVLGPLAEYFWFTKDWWNPVTITSTTVGIEDVMLGFTNAGIAAVLYETIFNKINTKRIQINKVTLQNSALRIIGVFGSALVPIFFSIYILHFNSFIANIIGYFTGTLFMIWRRTDLLKESILTALILPIVAMPVYIVITLLNPNYVNMVWQIRNISGSIILGAPIEDIIWYSATGLFIGGLFEYIFDLKLKNKKSK